MAGDMNPVTKLIPYLVGISVLSILLIYAHHHVYQQGVKDTEAVYAKKEAKIMEDMNQKIAYEQEKFRKTKEGLEKTIGEMAADNAKERDNAKAKINSLNADVLSGKRRLSVPTIGCTGNLPAKDSGSTITARASTEERAELLPSFGIALINLAAEADTGLRERNQCIELYNAVMKAVNSQ